MSPLGVLPSAPALVAGGGAVPPPPSPPSGFLYDSKALFLLLRGGGAARGGGGGGGGGRAAVGGSSGGSVVLVLCELLLLLLSLYEIPATRWRHRPVRERLEMRGVRCKAMQFKRIFIGQLCFVVDFANKNVITCKMLRILREK